ncbi:MAG TPA: GNAT family N-acetyltransferase [Chloroflexia bacterium]|nr:GNAT family N-acetyltransferase [Chloroflexia bacterium]
MVRAGHSLLPWARHADEPDPAVRPLAPADVPALRLPWHSRFSPASLTAHLGQYPGAGWLAPASGEYLVAEPWRRRDEITAILEIQARRARGALLRAVVAACRAAGDRVLLLPDGEWASHAALYAAQGFVRLERVLYYQLSGMIGPPAVTRPLPPLEFAPLTAHNLATVIAVDHAAFPWLWWNADSEFRVYRQQAGVQIWLGWTAGVPVAYAGFTVLERWGHLDRLAVAPAWHGRGYGAAMLAYVLGRMAALGVTRVTLSTQETNLSSQRLYRGFGFRPTAEAADIYGRWLGE